MGFGFCLGVGFGLWVPDFGLRVWGWGQGLAVRCLWGSRLRFSSPPRTLQESKGILAACQLMSVCWIEVIVLDEGHLAHPNYSPHIPHTSACTTLPSLSLE